MKTSLLMSAIDNISPATKKATASQAALQKQLDETQQEALAINKALGNIKGYQTQQAAVQKAQAAFDKNSKSLAALQLELQGVEQPTAKQAASLADLEYKTQMAEMALTDKKRSLGKYERALRSANIALDGLEDAQDQYTTKSKRYREEIAKQRKELKALEQQAGQTAEATKAGSMGDMAGGASVAAGAVTTAGIVTTANYEKNLALIQNAVEHQLDFKYTNTDTSTLTEEQQVKQKEELSYIVELESGLKEFISSGKAGGITHKELSAAMIQIINSGVTDQGEIFQRLELSAQVAKTTAQDGADIAQIATFTNSLSTALQLSHEETRNLVGTLTANYAGNDIEGLLEDATEALSRAKGYGIETKDAAAMFATLTQSGINVSAANSAMDSAFEKANVGSAHATTAQNDAYALVGLTGDEWRDKFNAGPMEAIKWLGEATKNLDKSDKQEAFDQMLGSEYQIFMSMLETGNIDKSSKISNDFDKGGESLARRAERMEETTSAKAEAALGAATQALADTFEGAKPAVDFFLDGIVNVSTGISEFINGIESEGGKLAASIALVVGSLGAFAAMSVGSFKALGTAKDAIFGGKKGGALKAVDALKGDGCCCAGGFEGKFDTPDKKSKSRSKATSKAAGKAASKIGGKVVSKAIGAIPIIGSLYALADIASTVMTGSDISDHVTSLFEDDEKPKDKLIAEKALTDYSLGKNQNEVWSPANNDQALAVADSPNLEIPLNSNPIPTPEDVPTPAPAGAQSLVRRLEVVISGKVEGLTPEGEIKLIERVSEALSPAGMAEAELFAREGY